VITVDEVVVDVVVMTGLVVDVKDVVGNTVVEDV
jgi:hypothetical protein